MTKGLTCLKKFNFAWISIGLLNTAGLFGQQPENWVNEYAYPDISPYQFNAIYATTDSALWVFGGVGVWEITSFQSPPVKVSDERNIFKPVSDGKGNLVYYYGDRFFWTSENDLRKGLSPDSHQILNDDLALCCRPEETPGKIRISCIALNPYNHDIWVGLEKGGLISFSRTGNKYAPKQSFCAEIPRAQDDCHVLPDNTPQFLAFDRLGKLWAGFERDLCIHTSSDEPGSPWKRVVSGFRPQNFYFHPQKHDFWLLAEDRNSRTNCLLGFKNDDQELEPQVIQLWNVAQQRAPRDIVVDRDGDLWLAGDDIFRGEKYAPKDAEYKVLRQAFDHGYPHIFSRSNGYPGGPPLCLNLDREGILWIAAGTRGLYYLKKGPGLVKKIKHPVSCTGDSDGRFFVRAVSGFSPFVLRWKSHKHGSDSIPNFQLMQEQEFPNISADTFEFTLTDRFGNTSLPMKVRMPDPEPLSGKPITLRKPYYFNSKDGRVYVEHIAGGKVESAKCAPKPEDKTDEKPRLIRTRKNTTNDETIRPPKNKVCIYRYRFSWDSLPMTNDFLNEKLDTGRHTVTIFDSLGCKTTLTFNLVAQYPFNVYENNKSEPSFDLEAIHFNADSSGLPPNADYYLDKVVDWLNDTLIAKSAHIRIIGHTNDRPTDTFADALSLNRAKSVQQYLIQKGVDAQRLEVVGAGKRYPRFSNDTPTGRQRNQRVEFKILRQ